MMSRKELEELCASAASIAEKAVQGPEIDAATARTIAGTIAGAIVARGIAYVPSEKFQEMMRSTS